MISFVPGSLKGCPPAAAMEQASAQQPGPPITTAWPKLAQYLSVVDALAAAQASKAWHHAVTDASPWAPRRIEGAKAAVAACEAAAAAARARANVPHKYRRSRLMDLEDRPAYRNFVSGEVGALSLARILGACSLHGKFVDLGSCLCGNQILRRVHAESSRRPLRHRRGTCSMAWRCRLLAARRDLHGRVIAENCIRRTC